MKIFENAHFLIVDKPAGWLSVPSRFEDKDERTVTGRHWEEALKIRLWPVHRLDVEVTGLLMFAKDARSHAQANRWFEERAVHKEYEALSELSPEIEVGKSVTWTSLLVRGKKRAFERPYGKNAITVAQATLDGPWLRWKLNPETGRPHQLRYEMAKHGAPVLGDALYGSKISFGGGIALRARKLSFPVPGQALGLPAVVECSSLERPTSIL